MSNIEVQIPSNIFRTALEAIRDSFDVTSIVDSSNQYLIYISNIDRDKLSIKNRITLSGCGELDGYHLIREVYEDHIIIETTSGLSYELGTLYAFPYFRSGTKSILISEQNIVNEYPFCHHLIRDNDTLGVETNEVYYMQNGYELYFMDKCSFANDITYNSDSDRIRDSVIERMLEYTIDFIEEISKIVDIESSSISEYLKEGSGNNPDIKQGSTYNASIAGIKLLINIKIPYKYKNC